MPSALAHYQEIALKGKNRPWFLNRLLRNLRAMLADLDVQEVRAPMGRIEVTFRNDADWPAVRDRLSRAFGLANFSLCHRGPTDLDALVAAVVRDLPDTPVASFRVRVRRADKQFPVPSPELERLVGQRVQAARGWPVDLSRPALVVGIEIVPGNSYY